MKYLGIAEAYLIAEAACSLHSHHTEPPVDRWKQETCLDRNGCIS